MVWSPKTAREFLKVLAAAAYGEAFCRGISFLIGREGEQLAAPLVTIVDDATIPGELGSRPFDDEGLISRPTTLFDAGTFHNFLFDTYSARRAGRASTANAQRATRFQLAMIMTIGVGYSNLRMGAGESTPEEITAGVERGLYLTDLLGFGENQTTGDFSRGAAGIWIEDGSLAYPVSEISIAGRLQEMLADIDAVGNDVAVLGRLGAPTFRTARMVISGS